MLRPAQAWQQWREQFTNASAPGKFTMIVLGLFYVLAGGLILLYVLWTSPTWFAALRTMGPTWLAAGLAALPNQAELSKPMTRGDGLILGIVLFLAIWVASRERDQ